jgi:hypothetical protein
VLADPTAIEVGQHAQENVGFGAALGVMEDRAFSDRRLHIAKGVFSAGEQDVDAPEFVA